MSLGQQAFPIFYNRLGGVQPA